MYTRKLIADLGLVKGSASAHGSWLLLLLLALGDSPDADEIKHSTNPARELLGRLAPHLDCQAGQTLRQMLNGAVDRLDPRA